MRASKEWLFVLTAILALTRLWAGAHDGPAEAAALAAKVDPQLLSAAAAGETEFLVFLAEQADLSGATTLPSKNEKGLYVYRKLVDAAARTQPPVLEALRVAGAQTNPLWVTNAIWAKGGLAAIAAAAGRPEVIRVYQNPVVHFKEPEAGEGQPTPETVEANIAKVGAPTVWAMGYTGQGVVVGGQDTGYQWDHPALKPHYRGWNGTSADHDYNWHDAIHSGGGSCGANTTAPCDDYGHGTHTMGIMTGDDGAGNQIGVAPGAKWIGCRNMDQGNGTPSTYLECFQWFLAPTDISGMNPDPSKSPDVINNSWVCPPSEGCTDVNVLRTAVENLRAAGIVVVVSAGNGGSSCATVADPPAIYAASLSVGATDNSDAIASFSSRGPVTIDSSDRRKPDVSAPGVSVRSSVPTSTYTWMSGTSMAGPHVAGMVALLLSARPDLSGQVDQIEQAIERNAHPLTTSQGCGGDTSSSVPNNVYGYGSISAPTAVSDLLSSTADADGDGVTNATDCRPYDSSVWASPSEARDLRLSRGGSTGLTWSAPLSPGCTSVTYDLLRSSSPSGFGSASCLATGTTSLSASDGGPGPASGSAYYYLVRAKNLCGGSLGTDSEGHARQGSICP